MLAEVETEAAPPHGAFLLRILCLEPALSLPASPPPLPPLPFSPSPRLSRAHCSPVLPLMHTRCHIPLTLPSSPSSRSPAVLPPGSGSLSREFESCVQRSRGARAFPAFSLLQKIKRWRHVAPLLPRSSPQEGLKKDNKKLTTFHKHFLAGGKERERQRERKNPGSRGRRVGAGAAVPFESGGAEWGDRECCTPLTRGGRLPPRQVSAPPPARPERLREPPLSPPRN